MAWGGIIVLAIMLLSSIATLPLTTARVTVAATDDAPTMHMPRRYERTNLEQALMPPFWAPHAADERKRFEVTAQRGERPWHVLGTDRLGRDLLTRLFAGGGISLTIGLAAATIAVLIGTLYGSIAGACGGRVDAVMMRIVDVLYGLPAILLVVLFAVAVDGIMDNIDARVASAGKTVPAWLEFMQRNRSMVNVVTLLVAIGSVSWLTMARVIRGQVLTLKRQPFMEACRAIGVPAHRQFVVHLLPNLLGPIVVYATLTAPAAILSESFLSFLGIGVREPLPSWGNLAASGLNELNVVRARWWLLFWPCFMIALTLVSLNFVGEALRDHFDIRRRSGTVIAGAAA